MNKILIGIFLFFLNFGVYSVVAGRFNWQLEKTQFAYFNLLAESFLSRRYDLIHPPVNLFDLTVYKGAVYLPWGPLPALLIMPIIKVFGINFSDKIYTVFFGSLDVVIFYFVLLEFSKLHKKLRLLQIVLLSLFFAFGTVHFATSVNGRVWFTSQVLSLTVFLLSLLFLLKCITERKVIFMIISSGLFLLALLGRLWYIWTLPMYGLTMASLSRKQMSILLVSILIGISLFVRMYGFYNYRRFGSLMETGYTYQQEADNFAQLRSRFGRYNIHYFPQNMWYQLLNPFKVSTQFPYIRPDPYGNGLLIVSPLFLLLFLWKKIKKNSLAQLFVSGSALFILQTMLFYGTGFFQFGHRYLLEVIPLLILLVALLITTIPQWVFYILVVTSIIINTLGAIWFVFAPI